jgi:hypothetical protein
MTANFLSSWFTICSHVISTGVKKKVPPTVGRLTKGNLDFWLFKAIYIEQVGWQQRLLAIHRRQHGRLN